MFGADSRQPHAACARFVPGNSPSYLLETLCCYLTLLYLNNRSARTTARSLPPSQMKRVYGVATAPGIKKGEDVANKQRSE